MTITKSIKTTTYSGVIQYKDGITTSFDDAIVGKAANLAACKRHTKKQVQDASAIIIYPDSIQVTKQTYVMDSETFFKYATLLDDQA